jgi:hypothetical protein
MGPAITEPSVVRMQANASALPHVNVTVSDSGGSTPTTGFGYPVTVSLPADSNHVEQVIVAPDERKQRLVKTAGLRAPERAHGNRD